MEISNKVAVVTGGASGLGACMEARFAREGAAASSPMAYNRPRL